MGVFGGFGRIGVREVLQRALAALDVAADCVGGPEDVSGGDGAYELAMSDGGQAHGGDATAAGAVGVAAELAGLDAGFEIRRKRAGGLGEDAVSGRGRRRQKLFDRAFCHVELGLMLANLQKGFDDGPALLEG